MTIEEEVRSSIKTGQMTLTVPQALSMQSSQHRLLTYRRVIAFGMLDERISGRLDEGISGAQPGGYCVEQSTAGNECAEA